MSARPPVAESAPDAAGNVLLVRKLPGVKLEAPLRLGRSATYAVVFPGRTAREALVAMLRGEARAEPGAVEVLGADLARVSRVPRPGFPPALVWVPPDGGLISTLNAWENIALPATYHRPEAQDDLPWLARTVMLQIGLEPQAICGRQPLDLNVLERRLVSFVRAVAMAPELLVLDGTLDDLEGAELERAQRMFPAFARILPFRTLVHLGAKSIDWSACAEPRPTILGTK